MHEHRHLSLLLCRHDLHPGGLARRPSAGRGKWCSNRKTIPLIHKKSVFRQEVTARSACDARRSQETPRPALRRNPSARPSLLRRGPELITDREYDALFKELQELEKDFPNLVTPESPTQRSAGLPAKNSPASNISCRCSRSTRSRPVILRRRKRNPTAISATASRTQNTLEEFRSFDTTIRKQLGRDQIQYIIEPKVDAPHGRLAFPLQAHRRHGQSQHHHRSRDPGGSGHQRSERLQEDRRSRASGLTFACRHG